MKAITLPGFDAGKAAKGGFAILATGVFLWAGVLLLSLSVEGAAAALREIDERSKRIAILEGELAQLTTRIAENLDAVGASDLSGLASAEATAAQLYEDRAAAAAEALTLELSSGEPSALVESAISDHLSVYSTALMLTGSRSALAAFILSAPTSEARVARLTIRHGEMQQAEAAATIGIELRRIGPKSPSEVAAP